MLKVYTPRHQPDEVWVAIRCPKRNMMRRLSLFLGPLAMYWCLWNLRLTALYTTLPLSAQQQERMASGMESTTDSRRTASQHAATKATTEVDNTKPVLSTRNVLRMTELADRTQRTFFNQDDYRNVTNCPSHLAEDDVQVTLVTQLSTHRLWLAKEICTRWTQAPIVMLVYFPDEELFANISAPFREEIAAACPQVNLLYAVNDDANQTLYPINLLRNLALEAAQTSHVLLADADFLPSSELSDEIQTALGVRQQARQHLQIPKDDLDALVVPAFEFQFQWKSRQQAFLKDPAELSHLIPRSFQTLKECVNSTSCTVFHEKHYPSGHRSTRTHEWLREEWYETLDKESTPEETSFRDIRHVRCSKSISNKTHRVALIYPSPLTIFVAQSCLQWIPPFGSPTLSCAGVHRERPLPRNEWLLSTTNASSVMG
jgi:hypothetical protein